MSKIGSLKKILYSTILIFTIFFFSGCNVNNQYIAEINVYNWGEYISNGTKNTINVNELFTKETGIKVNYSTFQNNEDLFAKLSGGGAEYDVIIPSDYMVSRLIENDMLYKLNFDNIPNYKMIDDNFKNLQFDPKNEYSVPYTWGMVGLLYNESVVNDVDIDVSWNILWSEKYKGKILMFDNPRDAFAISLLSLGYSINSENSNEWHLAAEKLKRQKQLVQAYVMDQIFDKMSSGEAVLAPYYAGDFINISRNNKNVKFIFPRENTNRFVDSMCIPKNSSNKEYAEKYINFMCRTDISCANAVATGYSTPQKDAYNLLDDSLKFNKFLYPDYDTIRKSEVFCSVSPEISKIIDDSWIDIKIGESTNKYLFVIIILSFLLLYILVLIYNKYRFCDYKNINK